MIKNEYNLLVKKYNCNNIFDNINLFVDLVKRVYAKIFNLKTIQPNQNLEKTESDANFKTFENTKSKRNRNDNKQLDNFRNNYRYHYNNKSGMYSRLAIIERALNDLWNTQQSVEYIAQTGLSSLIGVTGTFICYIDYEMRNLFSNPLKYLFVKAYDVIDNMIQGYVTRVLVDQSCLYFSLLDS